MHGLEGRFELWSLRVFARQRKIFCQELVSFPHISSWAKNNEPGFEAACSHHHEVTASNREGLRAVTEAVTRIWDVSLLLYAGRVNLFGQIINITN